MWHSGLYDCVRNQWVTGEADRSHVPLCWLRAQVQPETEFWGLHGIWVGFWAGFLLPGLSPGGDLCGTTACPVPAGIEEGTGTTRAGKHRRAFRKAAGPALGQAHGSGEAASLPAALLGNPVPCLRAACTAVPRLGTRQGRHRTAAARCAPVRAVASPRPQPPVLPRFKLWDPHRRTLSAVCTSSAGRTSRVTVPLRAGAWRGCGAVPSCTAAGARRERGWCPRARSRRSVRSCRRAGCGAEAAPAAPEEAAATAALPRPPLPPSSPTLRPFPLLPQCLRAFPSARGPWAPRRPPPPEQEEAGAGDFLSEPLRRGNAAPPIPARSYRRPPPPDSRGLGWLGPAARPTAEPAVAPRAWPGRGGQGRAAGACVQVRARWGLRSPRVARFCASCCPGRVRSSSTQAEKALGARMSRRHRVCLGARDVAVPSRPHLLHRRLRRCRHRGQST